MFKKLIKGLCKFLFVLLTIIIVSIVCVYMYAGYLIKTGVEKFVPEITQTAVQLKDVDISLLKGRISLNGLYIGNPKGYASKEAFGLNKVIVLFDPKSVLTDKIIIQQILIDGTKVSAEATYQNGKISSNLTQIQKNIESYLAKTTSSQEKPKAQKEEKEASHQSTKQLIIRDLQINNSSLTLGLLQKTVTVNLPNIHQKNIGEKGKSFDWKQAIVYVFDLISVESVKGTATAVKDFAQKNALELINSANALGNVAKEKAQNVLDETAGNAGNVLKGLLGK